MSNENPEKIEFPLNFDDTAMLLAFDDYWKSDYKYPHIKTDQMTHTAMFHWAVRRLLIASNNLHKNNEAQHQEIDAELKTAKNIRKSMDKRLKEAEKQIKTLQDTVHEQCCAVSFFHHLCDRHETQITKLNEELSKMKLQTTKLCVECHAEFQPTKSYHVKCKSCFTRLKTIQCTICEASFTQKHRLHKLCDECSKKRVRPKNKNA